MTKNVLVVGTGRFGTYTIEKLSELGHEVLAVDRDEEKINKVLPFVSGAEIGDSTDEDFLRSLGIDEFDLCIVAIGDDFMCSLETASLLKDLGATKVVARATSELQEKLLLRCGADAVVFPERQLGRWTAIRHSTDNISDYVELPDGYTILTVDVPFGWEGHRIGDLDIRRSYEVNILGVSSAGQMHMTVTPDTILMAGERILVLGKYENLRNIFHL